MNVFKPSSADSKITPVNDQKKTDQKKKKGKKQPQETIIEEEVEPIVETYPLKKPAKDPEVLLVSYNDAKPFVEKTLGFKCEDA
jgi:hypothetical protein